MKRSRQSRSKPAFTAAVRAKITEHELAIVGDFAERARRLRRMRATVLMKRITDVMNDSQLEQLAALHAERPWHFDPLRDVLAFDDNDEPIAETVTATITATVAVAVSKEAAA